MNFFFFPFFRCFSPSIPTLSLPVAYLSFHSFLSPDKSPAARSEEPTAKAAHGGRRSVVARCCMRWRRRGGARACGGSASGAVGGQVRGDSGWARGDGARRRRGIGRRRPRQRDVGHGGLRRPRRRRSRVKRRAATAHRARSGWRAKRRRSDAWAGASSFFLVARTPSVPRE
jgi:hypothetical protein